MHSTSGDLVLFAGSKNIWRFTYKAARDMDYHRLGCHAVMRHRLYFIVLSFFMDSRTLLLSVLLYCVSSFAILVRSSQLSLRWS